MVNFGPLAAEIDPVVWGTPANFNMFRVLAALLHSKFVRWCPDGEFLPIFLRPVFAASRVQHVSDLHLKFALRPHHVWKYGVHPICDG